jgi:hypothetical protein
VPQLHCFLLLLLLLRSPPLPPLRLSPVFAFAVTPLAADGFSSYFFFLADFFFSALFASSVLDFLASSCALRSWGTRTCQKRPSIEEKRPSIVARETYYYWRTWALRLSSSSASFASVAACVSVCVCVCVRVCARY